jgi:hypothetical protein
MLKLPVMRFKHTTFGLLAFHVIHPTISPKQSPCYYFCFKWPDCNSLYMKVCTACKNACIIQNNLWYWFGVHVWGENPLNGMIFPNDSNSPSPLSVFSVFIFQLSHLCGLNLALTFHLWGSTFVSSPMTTNNSWIAVNVSAVVSPPYPIWTIGLRSTCTNGRLSWPPFYQDCLISCQLSCCSSLKYINKSSTNIRNDSIRFSIYFYWRHLK